MKLTNQHVQKSIQIAALGVSAAIIIAAVSYVVYQNIELKKKLNTFSSSGVDLNELEKNQELTSLLKQIGSVITLPENEAPTIATILDATTLKTNPFFAQAINGDKVIVYKQAGKAFLYRPETKKVIETGSFGTDILEQTNTQLGAEETGNFKLSPSPVSTMPTKQSTVSASPTSTIKP